LLRPEDVLVLTADHGNDPTRKGGTDHTREYVPLLAWGPRVLRGVPLGTRASLADIGATVAELFQLRDAQGTQGRSFAPELFGIRREPAATAS
jgi:phosphopentomutase